MHRSYVLQLKRPRKTALVMETPNVVRKLQHFISMPSKSATFRRALSFLQNDAPFICPSCRHRKALSTYNASAKGQLHRLSRPNPPHDRKASTIASVTAVNAQRDIPPAFQKLHASLSALEHEAAVYVNISQLKLALRGLESENAVTRVAGLTHISCFDVTAC